MNEMKIFYKKPILTPHRLGGCCDSDYASDSEVPSFKPQSGKSFFRSLKSLI